MFESLRPGLWFLVLTACGAERVSADDLDLPGPSECLPEGEAMSAETCLAVVEEAGRQPTSSANATGGIPSDPNDPRLDDPEYLWLASEIERCTCVCCHVGSWGGSGVHRFDMEYEPVWIDSASRWSLSVLIGDSDNPARTLPTTDPERMRRVVEREMERRDR